MVAYLMEKIMAVGEVMMLTAAQEKASEATLALVADLEAMIKGDRARAVLCGNVAAAAAQIIFTRYGIAGETFVPVYEEAFAPVVALSTGI